MPYARGGISQQSSERTFSLLSAIAIRESEMEFPRDPFLLPLCSCGGATRLSHVEPHPVDEQKSLRTYVCQTCGSAQTHAVGKRSPGGSAPPRRERDALSGDVPG